MSLTGDDNGYRDPDPEREWEPEPEPEQERDPELDDVTERSDWPGSRPEGGDAGPPASSRSVDSGGPGGAWDDNRTETTAADGPDEEWDCCGRALPPMEAEDLAGAARAGPDRLAATRTGRPRRLAVCHNIAGHYGGVLGGGSQQGEATTPRLLTRQDSGSPPLSSVLLVKYYDAHDRLGVFDGHEGAHLGDLGLTLEPGSQFVDLCVSDRYQTVYLADRANNRVYAVDLTGRLRCTVAKRLSGPQAVCSDDRVSLLFVCQRRKVRMFQQQQHQKRLPYAGSLKSPEFRDLVSAAARDGRLWLADSQADRIHVYTIGNHGPEPLRSIALRNPQCLAVDASGSAFATSGEPLHRVTVYGPDGGEVGSFGGWGNRPSRMKLPVGICAYQLSHLVDKRMVAVCCFAEHCIRMYALKSVDTSVI